MPKPFQYKAGSLVYFRGDPADKVFILQTGQVNLTYQDIETGGDVHDAVQPGEFFGVKSALGRYPREENAMTIKDATVMAFTVPEFEALAAANTRIIMKMLKVFSNQLRKVHKQVSSLMATTEEQNPEEGLFSVGEYYFKARNYSHAKYIFGRYLTYYPTGQYVSKAADYVRQAGLFAGKPGSPPGGAAPQEQVSPNLPSEESAPNQAPEEAAPEQNLGEAAKAYYDAVSFMSQQKYQQAYLALKKIVSDNSDPEYTAKSQFEIGKCLFLLNNFEDCIKHYTMLITKYPKHPDLADALFYMGQCYEKNNNKNVAVNLYKKILTMSTDEDDGIRIKTKRALKALEA
jgi:TolA-binding protein